VGVYAAAAAVGTFTVAFDVAYFSVVPQVVAKKNLVAANARLSGTASVSETAGPAIAGFLIHVLGAALTLFVDVFTYVVSVVALQRMELEEPHTTTGPLTLRPMCREIREGITFVVRQAVLARIVVANAAYDFGYAVLHSVYLLYLYRELDLSPGEVGFLAAVTGVANVVGAITITRVVDRIGLGPTLAWSILVGAVASALVPLAGLGLPILVLVVINLVSGLTNAWYDINQYTMRQGLTPERLLGRVNATVRMAFAGPRPLGYLLGGVLGTQYGLTATLLTGAALSIVGALTTFARPIRGLRGFDDEQPVSAQTPTSWA